MSKFKHRLFENTKSEKKNNKIEWRSPTRYKKLPQRPNLIIIDVQNGIGQQKGIKSLYKEIIA